MSKEGEESPLTADIKYNNGWSPVDGSGEAFQEGPMFSMKVESYEEFHPKANRKVGITQSAPMGGRMVKQVSWIEPGRGALTKPSFIGNTTYRN